MTKSSEGLSRQDATLLQLASVEFARRFALAKEIRARLTATDVQIIMDRHRGFLGIVLMLGEELEAFIIRDYIYLLFMRSDDAVINTVVRSYRILDKIKRDRKYQNYMESIRTFYKTWGFIGHEYRIADQLDGLEVNIRKKLRDRQSSRQRFIDDILPKWMAWSSNYCARSNIRTIRRVYNSAEVVRADEEYSTISRIFGTALATENIIKSAIARAVFSEGDIDIFSATL